MYCYRADENPADTDNVESTTLFAETTEVAEVKDNHKSSTFFIGFESALYIIIPVLLLVLAVVLFVPFRRKKKNVGGE